MKDEKPGYGVLYDSTLLPSLEYLLNRSRISALDCVYGYVLFKQINGFITFRRKSNLASFNNNKTYFTKLYLLNTYAKYHY